MRKLIYGGLFLATVGIIIVSCEKKDLNPIDNQTKSADSNSSKVKITSNGKMLIFETVEDYELAVNNPSLELQENLKSEISQMPHKNWLEKTKENSDSENNLDEYLSLFLNEDLIVQIGKNLYKLDPQQRLVYVLDANNSKDNYSDLKNINSSNKNIQIYSFDEDVIDLVENKEGSEKAGCQNTDKKEYNWNIYEEYTDPKTNKNYKFKRRIIEKYDNAGIYRKLYSEFEHKEAGTGISDETYFTLCYYYAYDVKNGSYGSGSNYPPYDYWSYLTSTATGIYTHYDDKLKVEHYSGTKCLKKFKIRAWCWYRNRGSLHPQLYELQELNRGY